MGADSTTSVNLAAKAVTLKGSISMTFEEWLKSLGIDQAAMTPEGTAIMQTQYDLIQNPPEGAVAPQAAAAASAVAAWWWSVPHRLWMLCSLRDNSWPGNPG